MIKSMCNAHKTHAGIFLHASIVHSMVSNVKLEPEIRTEDNVIGWSIILLTSDASSIGSIKDIATRNMWNVM